VEPVINFPGHVFISYARGLHDDQVDALQRHLNDAGVEVWRDRDRLWPGADWRLEIRKAITNDVLVFIACFSRQSLARARSYQNEEIQLAIEDSR
jgi:TIR domain